MLAYNSYKYLYLETKNISYDNADDIDNKYKRLTNESIADYASVNSKVHSLIWLLNCFLQQTATKT